MSPVSEYQVGAALWVIRAVGARGANVDALDAAFHSAVTQGRFPRPDLDNALRVLKAHALLTAGDGTIRHHDSLRPLLSLADDEALELLSVLLGSADPDDPVEPSILRELVGAAGEEAVRDWCISELLALGHGALAEQVQRVSLISDRFGYDVSAPFVAGGTRKLEVKTTTSRVSKSYRFFLSRNEYEVGRRNPRSWALVACRMGGDTAVIVGWCRASELERYLPDDANGRWTDALVTLPVAALIAGAPSSVS